MTTESLNEAAINLAKAHSEFELATQYRRGVLEKLLWVSRPSGERPRENELKLFVAELREASRRLDAAVKALEKAEVALEVAMLLNPPESEPR